MTGLFGRFRSWVGSLFGGESEAEEPETEPPATTDEGTADAETTESAPDDAATTADTADPTTPESATAAALEEAIAKSEGGPRTTRIRREDDASAEGSPFELSGGPKTVRLSADDEGATESDDADSTDSADAPERDDAEDESADPTAYDYRCTVCGTAVETPDGPCPLCRSSQVVPRDDAGDVYDAPDGGGPSASGPIGRTSTSISDADDAVERLQNLRRGDDE